MLSIDDPRWHKIGSRLWFGEFDGKKVGVVMATMSNPSFDTFALNVGELNRLKAGKNDGKIDEGLIIAVEVSGTARTHRGEMTLADATVKLNSIAPLNGRFGAFYSLPSASSATSRSDRNQHTGPVTAIIGHWSGLRHHLRLGCRSISLTSFYLIDRRSTMSIEEIKQKELSPEERDVLSEDAARWTRMGAGSHLDDWLAYQPGLGIRRKLAMQVAHVNKPKGRGYNEAFGVLMRSDGLEHMDKHSISALLWLDDQPERMQMLKEIRSGMSPGERARLNSPITAKKRVADAIKARADPPLQVTRASPVAQLKNQITEQANEIAQLEQKLAELDGDDDFAHFDLKKDNADDIAVVIVNSVSEKKAKSIAAGIVAWFDQRSSGGLQ